ncbi:glucosamine-6-phosphate deaminase, putative, partial [Perkinsus marinus ATCC 50983]
IGFFLGGIGRDGHIAFNVCGSDHRSTTRLAQLNYPTQAAASADLGGIDAVKAKCAITIGLGTITYNPDCVCILIAAGEAKAPMVANGVQEETNIKYPSHAIRVLPNAAFYVTKGAAKLLVERNIVDLKEASNVGIEDIEKILVDVSVSSRKRLVDLDTVDVNKDPMGKVLMDRMGWSKEDLHDT